ncbi:TIGR04338 family metallohydrolase [Nocardia sp. NPDC057227]|uniref:TIGR04338 family metallohydrolase n=1 Tax=Nocardia sp. NPDC057227 TaxID=3346056 RepID=UPI00362EACDD
MTPRDSQRAAVYDAEQLVRGAFERADEFGNRTVEVFGSRLTLPVERRFGSVESVAGYVERVLALNWVRAEWPRAAVPVRVRARRGAGAAHYEPDGAVLAVPVGRVWALRELVVLHELAHHLAPDSAEPAHGPAFCARYLALLDGVVGPEAALLLRSALLGTGARIG